MTQMLPCGMPAERYGLSTDTNPRWGHAVSYERPQTPLALFSETHFTQRQGWGGILTSPRTTHGYVEGLDYCLGQAMIGGQPSLLHVRRHFEYAQKQSEVSHVGSWSRVLKNLACEPVSGPYARDQLRENTNLAVAKLMMVPLALEAAIAAFAEKIDDPKLRPSRFIAYDCVRIRIAGYNFDYKDFDQEKLRKLEGKNKNDFYARAAEATGQNKDLFEDIARGYLVTYDTAYKVRSFINVDAPEELHLGDIFFFPDHQRSKGRKPTQHEVIEPTLLAAA